MADLKASMASQFEFLVVVLLPHEAIPFDILVEMLWRLTLMIAKPEGFEFRHVARDAENHYNNSRWLLTPSP